MKGMENYIQCKFCVCMQRHWKPCIMSMGKKNGIAAMKKQYAFPQKN